MVGKTLKSIYDPWFTQDDLRYTIENHVELNKDWVVLYENRESAIEHYIYFSIPIKQRVINVIINDESWGLDGKYTLKKVWAINGKHFLSKHFRQYFSINLIHNEYKSNSHEIYAKTENAEIGGTKVKKYLVKSAALTEYLSVTKQSLLYGIRSHRYSERSLHEFGFSNSENEFSTNRVNYIYNLKEISNREQLERPRARSMSLVFGKYLVMK